MAEEPIGRGKEGCLRQPLWQRKNKRKKSNLYINKRASAFARTSVGWGGKGGMRHLLAMYMVQRREREAMGWKIRLKGR
ncbi:unnamed protein product, partial [Dovyalis caffra]